MKISTSNLDAKTQAAIDADAQMRIEANRIRRALRASETVADAEENARERAAYDDEIEAVHG